MQQNLPYIDLSEPNWNKEAQSIYKYLLKEEDRNSKEVASIMKAFEKQIMAEIDPNKRRNLFSDLKMKLYALRHKDHNFERTLFFILLIAHFVNKFQANYEQSLASTQRLSNLLIVVENTDLRKKIEQLIKEEQKIFNKQIGQAQRKADLILRTEMYRYVNQERLNYFRKVGYQFKTNFMVNDERTGEDSRYFNSLKQVRRLDEDFEYEWKGQIRRFPFNPDRQNDRQILIPFIT
jgi:hypothetical protein